MVKCWKCRHCTDSYEWVNEEDQEDRQWLLYCEIENSWLPEEEANEDTPCDMYDSKLDDYETEESRA